MLVPQRHMWYLPWSLIVFLIAGTANKWCTLSISSSPQKYPAELGLEKYMDYPHDPIFLYISTLKMRFVPCSCRMSALSKSFLFRNCKSKFETRRFGVLWLEVLSNVEMIPGRARFITRWNCCLETCGNLWKLWVLISDWSKMYERHGGGETNIEFWKSGEKVIVFFLDEHWWTHFQGIWM